MAQYCRYCAWCCYGDVAWCEKHQKTMSETSAKRSNHCKDFELNPIDAFHENERGYVPRQKVVKTYDQLSLEERGGCVNERL